MKLTPDDYQRIKLLGLDYLHDLIRDTAVAQTYVIPGKVQPKQRPMHTRNGNTYTPEATVEYEKRVVTSVRQVMKERDHGMWYCPVAVDITIYEERPTAQGARQELMGLNYLRPTRCDIDNQVKAILDGCNGVLFADDKQITQLFANRLYGPEPHARIEIWRAGISKAEADQIAKLI